MVYGNYTPYNPAAGTLQVTPIAYLARLFTYWRGSFKIHISFVSSSFHSVRCRFMWQPTPSSSALPTADLASSRDTYNVLMDINQQADYSILIPYEQCVQWSRVDNTLSPVSSCNGWMAMFLETQLTSTLVTPQPIYYQIFVSMADDAQFAVPTCERLKTYGNPFYNDPPTLLALKSDSVDEVEDEEEELFAQTGEKILECEVPSSSAACLRDTTFVCIMGSPVTTRRIYGESTVFEYTSVKQLSNMLTPIEKITSANTNTYIGRQFAPFGKLTAAYNDDAWNCMYNQIRAIYRFGRGSVRLTAIIDTSSIQATSYLRPGTEIGSTNQWTVVSNEPFIGTVDMNVMPGGFQYFMSTVYMPADIIIPYCANVPCLPYVTSATGDGGSAAYGVAGNITFSTQLTVGLKIIYFAATHDDFIFGSRTGIPLLKRVVTP